MVAILPIAHYSAPKVRPVEEVTVDFIDPSTGKTISTSTGTNSQAHARS